MNTTTEALRLHIIDVTALISSSFPHSIVSDKAHAMSLYCNATQRPVTRWTVCRFNPTASAGFVPAIALTDLKQVVAVMFREGLLNSEEFVDMSMSIMDMQDASRAERVEDPMAQMMMQLRRVARQLRK